MKKFTDNPLADFNGTIRPSKIDCLDEPDWDKLIIGPCVSVPGWGDESGGVYEA